jgi:nucleoside-diphosphate-sugar epimerase
VGVVITGASGFAGRHLAALCADQDVTGLSSAVCDLRNAAATRAAIAAAQPDVVYHLAARAHVGESAPLRPQNQYAVSKASADLLAGFHADAHGLRVIRARAFNHAGPGQGPTYAISSFARQAALGAERIVTGNPDTRRDYTDVRDVVRAYRLLAERAAPGADNVYSGRVDARAGGGARARARGRPGAAAPARGDGAAGLLRRAAGRHRLGAELAQTLQDALRWWRDEPARARTAAPRRERDRPPRS